MNVRVRLFAVLREHAGVGELALTMPERATVTDAVTRLATQFPSLRGAALKVMYAVNQEYADATAVLSDGDELALIPPVSGG